jgi:hypothetical protein
MMSITRVRLALVAGVIALAMVPSHSKPAGPPAEGQRWYVSALQGDDAADGRTQGTPFRTLPRALRVLHAGDTLVVMPGVYYHAPLEIRDLPSSVDRPIWILAEPRGKAVLSAAWPEAAEGKVAWRDEGGGVYSAAHGPVLFAGWRGHFLYRYVSMADLRRARAMTNGRYGEVNGPESGIACEAGRVYVKLPGNANPNGEKILLSPPFWGEPGVTAVVRVYNSPGLIIDGLRVQASGTFGIQFDAASSHPVVRNTVFQYCRAGLGLPSGSLVEWCEHTYPGFHEFSEEVRRRNDGHILTYPLVKDYQPANWYEFGIADFSYDPALGGTPPTGCEFRYNFSHEVFDGENLGSFNDSESHHNVYLYCYDNCVEMEAWKEGFGSENLRLHDNLLLGCPSAPLSHQNPDDLKGPQYVYRNVIYGYDDTGLRPWTLIKSKCYGKGQGFYYYHNLFWVDAAEVYWDEKDWPQEWLKTFDFTNNIFVFASRMRRPTGPQGSEALFHASHNLVVTPNGDAPILDALLRDCGRRLEDPAALQLRDPSKLEFALTAGSPAIDAGVRLPGYNDNAIGAPDVGPFEFGRDYGSDWPRPRQTAFNVNPPARITGDELAPAVVLYEE